MRVSKGVSKGVMAMSAALIIASSGVRHVVRAQEDLGGARPPPPGALNSPPPPELMLVTPGGGGGDGGVGAPIPEAVADDVQNTELRVVTPVLLEEDEAQALPPPGVAAVAATALVVEDEDEDEDEPPPIALPSVTSVDASSGQGGAGGQGGQGGSGDSRESMAPVDGCDISTAGRSLSVAKNEQASSLPPCQGCRSFEARIDTVCGDGGSSNSGYVLDYRMGPARGDVVLTSCPVDDAFTFRTVGGTAGPTPFTAQELAFLNKIADDLEADPTDDLDALASLEALVIKASRALAAWPAARFPVTGVFSSSDTRPWFRPADLLQQADCDIATVGEGVAPAAPVASVALPGPVRKPAFPPKVVAAPPNFPPKINGAPPNLPPKINGAPPVSASTPRPTSEPCTDICHVTSDGSQLALEQQCLTDSDLASNQNDYPCDFVATPDCQCDQAWTTTQFNLCTSTRPSCPRQNVVSQIDPDGKLLPSSESCPLMCRITYEPNPNTSNGYTFQWAKEPSCPGPNVTYVNDCDYVPSELCDCSDPSFGIDMVKGCARPDICEFTETVTVCNVSFEQGIVRASEVIMPTLKAQELLNKDGCDFIVDNEAGCPCVENERFDSRQFRRCAGGSCRSGDA